MPKHKLTTTAQLPRKLMRAGTETEGGKGLFELLTTTQLYALMQIAWRGPMRQNHFIGFAHLRTLKKALAHLKEKGWITYDPDAGYKLAFQWNQDTKTSWVWCWPLAFGHISMKARIMLCFVDEWVDGRYYINRGQLMKAMGLKRYSFYDTLKELKQAGLILETGRRVGKKGKTLVCARRFAEHFDALLDEILGSTDYLMRGHDDEEDELPPLLPGALRQRTCKVPRRKHVGAPEQTRGCPGANTQKGSPKGSLAGSPDKDSPEARRASPADGVPDLTLRQHIMNVQNIFDPAFLDQKMTESRVLDKFNNLLPEEQQILIRTCNGTYMNHWTAAIRAWDPLAYLVQFNPKFTEDGQVTLPGLYPPHDLDSIRSLLQAVPDLDAQLRSVASPYEKPIDRDEQRREADELDRQHKARQARKKEAEERQWREKLGLIHRRVCRSKIMQSPA